MAFARKRKKGLFLSIELVAVIVIITIIAAIVIAGIAHLFKIYKIYQITRDFSQYSEAAIQFKINYKYWPGDLPANKVNGIFQTLSTDATTLKDSIGLGKITGIAGGCLAFKEMSLAKLISFVAGSATCTDLTNATVANGAIPASSFDDALAIGIISDKTSPTFANNSKVLSDPTWTEGNPRIVLFRGTGMSGLADMKAPSLNHGGAVSPAVASDVDTKMDDGKPTTGILDAEIAAAAEPAPPACAYDDGTLVVYANSDDDSASKGCVLTYKTATV